MSAAEIYRLSLEQQRQLDSIKQAIKLAEEWCKDQSNGMTDGEVCIAAMRDIRKIVRKGK